MLHEDRRGEEGRGIIRIRIDGWVYIGLDICDKEGVILIEKIILVIRDRVYSVFKNKIIMLGSDYKKEVGELRSRMRSKLYE